MLLEDIGFWSANAKKDNLKTHIHKDIFNLAKYLLNCKWIWFEVNLDGQS